MSRASHLGRVAYALESSWGEISTTFGTALPHVGDVNDLIGGLTQPKQASNVTQQYRNAGSMPIRMPYGGSIPLRFYVTGHGSTTAGAVSATDVETFLGHVFGAGAVSASSGDTFTGGTASVPTTTSATGHAAGSIGWAGVLGDGRGEGQAYAVGTHASNNLTLLTALPGAPANADVMYSGFTINTEETAANADMKSFRFLFQTGNLQASAHGCFATSASFTGLGNGEVGMLEVNLTPSWWAFRSETFPTTAATEAQPSTNTAGSFFMQTRGTVTRATKPIRSFNLNYTMGVAPVMGPGGLDEFQTIVGAVRTRDEISLEVVVDSEAATTTPTEETAWRSDTSFKHVLYNLNGHATGQRVAFYLPNLCYDQNRPTQTNVDGINRVRFFLKGYTGTTTTSELTLSALRIGLG